MNNVALEQRTMSKKADRVFFIDNLKVFLTLLVIAHHAGQAYGPTGGFWQYKSSLNETVPWLGSFFGVNASFFMGLFFLLSGYFTPRSYDRKGGLEFLKDKLIRFGIPLLVVLLIIQPLEMYFYYSMYSGNVDISFIDYYQRIYFGVGDRPEWFKDAIGWPEMNFGHLWFVEHLLVYSIVYGLFRSIFSKRKIRENSQSPMYLYITLITLLIAVISAIVRIWHPIDQWTAIFGFLQAEVAHLPQYIILFITGIIAYREKWFVRFDKSIGYSLLRIGLLMATVVYLRSILPEPVKKILFSNWAFYETLMAICICWGMVVLFREKCNRISPIIKWMSENSYTAYIVHLPIVLIVQYSLDKIYIFGALGKFITVSMLSIIITYILSYFIRKLPYANKVM